MTDLPNRPKQSNFKETLAQPIDSTQTAGIILSDVPEYVPGGETVQLTLLNPKGVEHITATGWDTGTNTLSGVTRGLPLYTGGASTARSHGGGTTVVLGNPFQLYDDLDTALQSKVDLAGDTITGTVDCSGSGILNDAVFADATARDAAILAPVNGMCCYLTAEGKFTDYTGGSWIDRESGGTFPNASETVAGKVELATDAEAQAGTDVGGTGASLTALPSQIAENIQNQQFVYGVDSGAANAYVLTLAPALAALADGQRVVFKATNPNTGASTLNVNGLGAITMKKLNDNDLIAGDVEADQIVEVVYEADAGVFQVVSQMAQEVTEGEIDRTFIYGDTITAGDLLYIDKSDNCKLKRITSSAATWVDPLFLAIDSGVDTDTGKRVLVRGKVSGASFAAINPSWEFTGGGYTTENFGKDTNYVGFATMIDNSAGPECQIGTGTVEIKKIGTPTSDVYVSLVLNGSGNSTCPALWYYNLGTVPGVALNTTSIDKDTISGTLTDHSFDLTGATIPANCVAWLVFHTNGTLDNANYYQVTRPNAAVSTNSKRLGHDSWENIYEFNYSLSSVSVDPWDTGYAIRAYAGTVGSYGYGTNQYTYPWNRVIGYMLSDTEWYFDPKRRNLYFEDMSTSISQSTRAYAYTTGLEFRPSRAYGWAMWEAGGPNKYYTGRIYTDPGNSTDLIKTDRAFYNYESEAHSTADLNNAYLYTSDFDMFAVPMEDGVKIWCGVNPNDTTAAGATVWEIGWNMTLE